MPASMTPSQPSAVDRILEVASTAADTLANTSSEAPGMRQLRSIADTLVGAARRLSCGWSDRGKHVADAHLDAVLDAATARYPDAADVALRCDIMVIAAIAASETAEAEEGAAKTARLIESLRAEVSQLRKDRDEAAHAKERRRSLFGGRR